MAVKYHIIVFISMAFYSSMGSSFQNATAKLKIIPFDRRDCIGIQVGAETTIGGHEDCYHFDSTTPPEERKEEGILNGYVSCCYQWGLGGFRSIKILNSDPSAFDGWTLTKFTGLDCDSENGPEAAGSLDKAETCMNVFYDTGAEGAPSNSRPANALRVDCVTTKLSSIQSSSTIATNFASSSSIIASSKSLDNTTTQTLPSECYASARPSNTARFSETPRLITYITELEPVTEAVTTVLTYVPADFYGPRQYFTVVGPTTQFVTVTAELTPDVFVLSDFEPDKLAVKDYCQGTCGSCSIYFPYVDLLYWPVSSMHTACLSNKTAVTSNTISAPAVQAREPTIVSAGEGTVVLGGSTLVSPSAYLVFPGVSAADECGRRGSYYTSVTLAVRPEDLSSVVAHIPESLNIADLLCLPASLQPGGSYWEHSPWNDYPVRIIGEGYKLIISPPPELSSLDPSWAGCHADPFQGQDPLRALVPAGVLTPEATVSVPASSTHLQPSRVPASPWPRITNFPKADISNDPLLKPTSKKWSRPEEISGPEPQQEQGQSDEPALGPEPNTPSHQSGNPNALKSPGNPQPATKDPSENESQSGTLKSNLPVPLPPGVIDGEPSGDSRGAIVSTKPKSEIVMDGAPLPTSLLIITVAGNPYPVSQEKDEIVVAGNHLVPGGPAITISAEVISAEVNGIVVEGQKYHVHADINRSGNPGTADDEPNESDDALATGKNPSPNNPADPSTGPADPTAPSSSLPPTPRSSRPRAFDPTPNPTHEVILTLGTHPITANPTQILIDPSTTLLPGSPAVLVAGTLLSLNAAGELIIAGTRTVDFAKERTAKGEQQSGSSGGLGASSSVGGGLGGLILKGLGGASGMQAPANATAAPEVFRGVGSRVRAHGWWVWGVVGTLVVGKM